VSRREHRLKTCKFAEEKKLARPAGIICSWNWNSMQLTAAHWNHQAFVAPSVLVALCPTQKFKVQYNVERQEKIYFANFVASYVTCTEQYICCKLYLSFRFLERPHWADLLLPSLWNDRSCYRQLRIFVGFTSHLQSQIAAPAIKKEFYFFWTEGSTD